ncbi:MAG: hypothetical protein LBK59_10430 [Bifidobacteriaceae bacterium]|jgi:toxin-antitoxin system PIN domain toxin|nr:hypothetical protein [Bifidobacteriaceae bacterium]
MSSALLDVNVLLALGDQDHLQHALAARWFTANADQGWATCPVTENGFIRIISQPAYPNPITIADAARRLASAVNDPAHEFWACDHSFVERGRIRASRILGPSQVTDIYLLSMAVAHSGCFVTLDRRVDIQAVPGAGAASLVVLGDGNST